LSDYNYEHFDDYVRSRAAGAEFPAFRQRLHAGDSAPDFVATRLEDGARVTASELWRRRPVVMEFGSFT
jgi:hypothetical protein